MVLLNKNKGFDLVAKKNVFQIKVFVVIFAVCAAMTWAAAFPLIKLGMTAFNIANDDIGSKTLFAGVRFFLAGVIALIIAKITGHKLILKNKKDIIYTSVLGIVNTSLHYFFFYIGLSFLSGSRASIIDSSGTFFLIILAAIIFQDEHMTLQKIIGCILGFTGILIINIGKGSFQSITFNGDGMLILSALCSAFGGVLTRVITKRVTPLTATGYSLFIGGAVLIAAGLIGGGSLTTFSADGILILFLLVLVSIIGFCLYNQLICYNPIGEIAIFNSLIPIFGAILSCIVLGEQFYVKYIFAGVLVVLGVYVINRRQKN